MKVSRPRPLLAATVLAGLIALSSCSLNLPTDPSLETEASLPKKSGAQPFASRTSTTSVTGSAVIDGSKGGVLKVASWRVVVPPGAYSGSGTITIAIPDTTVAKCDLNISPSTLNHFSVPVVLRYQCTSSADADSRNLQWWDPSTKTWVVIPSWPDYTDNTRWAALSHFSTYLSGKAGWTKK